MKEPAGTVSSAPISSRQRLIGQALDWLHYLRPAASLPIAVLRGDSDITGRMLAPGCGLEEEGIPDGS